MNERYLFRGKRVDTGEWIIGGYAHTNIVDGDLGIPLSIADCIKHHLIFVSGRYYEIDPSTIGQCTGLKDKNGKLIFEGDIVVITMSLTNSKPIVHKSKVFWSEASWRVYWGSDRDGTRIDGFAHTVTFEVVGNVDDNPELLRHD